MNHSKIKTSKISDLGRETMGEDLKLFIIGYASVKSSVMNQLRVYLNSGSSAPKHRTKYLEEYSEVL